MRRFFADVSNFVPRDIWQTILFLRQILKFQLSVINRMASDGLGKVLNKKGKLAGKPCCRQKVIVCGELCVVQRYAPF